MSESMPSGLMNKIGKSWLLFLVLTIMAGLSAGLYLFASGKANGFGFPLDDAWIHLTYARNLVVHGEWAFIPGEPTAGSTSPLWTLILAAGYLTGLSPFTWVFCLGIILLGALAYQIEKGSKSFAPSNSYKIPLAGLVAAFEFHFVWSAVSGMETLLHALIIIIICLLLMRLNPPWLMLGLLCGISTWIRPDGLTLMAPIVFTGLAQKTGWRSRLQSCFWILLGFLLFFIPYLYFNYSLSGFPLPTTFYAKQAEYLSWQTGSILKRAIEILLVFLIGPAVILVPGFIFDAINVIKKREWAHLSMMVWMIGYLGLYMMRMPAYQHGRYLIPAMPVFFLFGLIGFFRYQNNKIHNHRYTRLIRFAWTLTLILVSLGFWLLGMRSYVSDVEFIETEMVDTAQWVAVNLPADAVVAAHDIGALGYFDTHTLVDLAGIITPEVIPFMRDENRLADYLDQQGVTHLVVFPDWYPALTADLSLMFTTGAEYAPSVGGTNLTVYVWK